MRRMSSGTHDRRAGGHQRIRGAGDYRRVSIKQPSGEKKNQDDRAQIDEEQAQMNPESCLSEDGHEQSIGSINPREFDSIDQLIRWNPFENKLAGIGVLTFVPT